MKTIALRASVLALALASPVVAFAQEAPETAGDVDWAAFVSSNFTLGNALLGLLAIGGVMLAIRGVSSVIRKVIGMAS